MLEGVFQDEHGDSRPAPISATLRRRRAHTGIAPGCTIFVKLWQFDPDDRTNLRLDTTTMSYVPDLERAGVELMPLFQDARESVRLERWAANAKIILPMPGGIELLVLDGEFSEGGDSFAAQSWLRLPAGAALRARAGASGCRVWVRPAISHIRNLLPPRPPEPTMKLSSREEDTFDEAASNVRRVRRHGRWPKICLRKARSGESHQRIQRDRSVLLQAMTEAST